MNPKINPRWKGLLAGSMISTALVGCVPEEDPQEPELQELDHAQVQQNLTESISNAMESIVDGLETLEESEMISHFLPGFFTPETMVVCEAYFDSDLGVEVENCQDEPTGPAISLSGEEKEEIIDFLETKIFTEENIEADEGRAITYLIGADAFCDEDDYSEPENYQECVSDVEALELRIRATSLAAGSVDLDLLFGPERYEPLALHFAPNKVSAAVDLGEAKETALFIADRLDEEPLTLPETFSGKVALTYEKSGDELAFTLGVLQAIDINGEGYSLQLASTPRALQFSLDTAAETLSAMLGLGAVDATFPITVGESEDYDYDLGEYVYEEGEEVPLQVQLAGLSLEATLFDVEDRIEIRDAGLGNGTSRIHLDGEEVISIDLNAELGRSLDLDVLVDIESDSIDIAVGPAFDLQLALAFHRVVDLLDDLEDFLLDDLIRITLDGVDPAVRINEFGLKILSGKLTLHSEPAEVTTEIEAGMCLVELDDVDNDDEDLHIFELFGAGVCEE